MNPLEANLNRLLRLQEAIENGEEIDWKKEILLTDLDIAVSGAYYTQEAVSRVKESDEKLREKLNV